MKKKPDGHIKFYTKREFEELAEENGFKVLLNVMTEIRFPRRGAKQYKDLLRIYNVEIVYGYGIQVNEDEVFITEKVLNMVMDR